MDDHCFLNTASLNVVGVIPKMTSEGKNKSFPCHFGCKTVYFLRQAISGILSTLTDFIQRRAFGSSRIQCPIPNSRPKVTRVQLEIYRSIPYHVILLTQTKIHSLYRQSQNLPVRMFFLHPRPLDYRMCFR